MNQLRVQDVHKRFGGVHALTGASLQVKKNTITALIGPNGSGKTTLFNCISKLVKQDSGSLHLQETNLSHAQAHEVARRVSRTFQDPRLFRHLTIQDHLAIASSTRDEQLLRALTKKSFNKQTAQQALKQVGLDKPLTTRASELSYGQRKLLDLAVAIQKPHEILLLDEPVAGVNPRLREQIKDVLKQLREQKETILVIEHDMNFVMDVADTIHVLAQGRVIATGTPQEIRDDPAVLEAYLGE